MFVVPPPDLAAVMARFLTLAQEVEKALPAGTAGPRGLMPTQITGAMRELESRLGNAAAVGTGDAARRQEIAALGDRACTLIGEMAELATAAGARETAGELELLSFPLVLWTVRHGAPIGTLEPVVDAAAALANRVREPAQLAQLYRELTEIAAAVPSATRDEADRLEPAGPWRVLVLNIAIVATRSHDPRLMEEAFDNVIRYLPGEAARFFEAAMGQMDAIGYPPQVRDVVTRYYRQTSAPATVH